MLSRHYLEYLNPLEKGDEPLSSPQVHEFSGLKCLPVGDKISIIVRKASISTPFMLIFCIFIRVVEVYSLDIYRSFVADV